jgi:transcriptional regulator with XRE-family HTH domain
MSENERQIKSSLSAQVVDYLRRRGMTLKQIGRMAGVSESFVSRVARKERGFTIEHLGNFERELKQPLPFLLLQSTPKESIPKDLQSSYAEALRLLQNSGKLRLDMSGEIHEPKSGRSGSRSRRIAG